MKGALLTAAVVAGASAVLFGSTLFGGFPLDASHGGDIYSLSALFDRFSHHIGEGEYPWYYPEFGSGAPVAAAWMYGLFSPATSLFLILPAGPAWVWSTILHLALAAFGLHLLARELGMRPAAAATAGIVYALSEWMIGRSLCGHLNLVWPAAWAPLVFWAVSRAAAGRPRAAPALGILLGLGLLAGHVQVWFYAGPVLVAFALVELRRHGFKRSAMISVLVGGLLAVGIAGVQWGFTLEYFGSLGDTSVPEMQHSVFTTPGVVMASKPFPGFLGYSPDVWRGGPVFYHESLAIGGLGVLLLAGFGLAGRGRGRWFWLSVLLLGLLIAGGYRNVFSSFLNHLPILSSGRAAGRALHLVVLAVAMLAGLGANSWLDPERRPSGRRVALVGGSLLFLTLACLLILRAGQVQPDGFTRGLPAVLGSLLSAAVVVAGILLVRRIPRAAVALPAAALAAVFVAGLPPVVAVSDQFYRRDPLEVLPTQVRTERVFLAGWGSMPVIEQHGMRTNRPILPVDSAWYGSVMECGSALVHRWIGIGVHVDKVNARQFLLEEEPETPELMLILEAMPPGSLFPVAEREVSDDDALRRLAESEIVLLLAGDAPPLPTGETESLLDQVEVVRKGPGLLSFRTRAVRSRWLYVAEKYYSDWRATIDGVEAVVHRANVAGMALALPPGEHEVEFRYRPASVTWGPALSLAAALIAFMGFFIRRR